jgi:Transposase DDE domain
VDLDSFIVTSFCLIDDALREATPERPVRSRGPAPALADSEVLTLEVVGEFLGLDQDVAIYRFFRRHYAAFFPALRRVHRTTFARQAANLWAIKERLWQRFLRQIPHEPGFALLDSFPIPACQFARAYRCRRFRGEAAYGKDTLIRQTFYGFRLHARLCWPGVISRFVLAPANVSELAAVPALTDRTTGLVLGDRNYHAPLLAAELGRRDIDLVAPFRRAQRDPAPGRAALISRFRYRIDTVFGQLVERYHAKKVWARDAWHLWSRLLRKILSHTLAVLLAGAAGLPPLHLAELLTD